MKLNIQSEMRENNNKKKKQRRNPKLKQTRETIILKDGCS